jgi:Cu(I)/Ag(I) efflux system periplasmic protein CusF
VIFFTHFSGSASRRLALAALLLAAGWASPPLLAQAPAAPQAPGEVTKIDKATARVTIRHGELKHLDMPAMNMVWRVRDPKSLDGLAVGDRVRFTGERIDGQFTVTSISKAP